MKHKFQVIASSGFPDSRPPISFRVCEYFSQVIVKQLLVSEKIILKSQWEVHLILQFICESEFYKSDYLFMPRTPTSVSKEELVKSYTVLIPMKLVKNVDEPYYSTIGLIQDAVTLFFTTTYKKVTKQKMDNFWKDTDYAYLLSLPYPAPLAEQRFLSDVVHPDGSTSTYFLDLMAAPEQSVLKKP